MTEAPSPVALHDLEPDRDTFLADVRNGLGQEARSLPCKYFYDLEGSRLFDRICELQEYYPTRTELGIMRSGAAEMAARIGPGRTIVEIGSGSSLKSRLLLDALDAPVAYVPVDISREHLLASAKSLAKRHPEIEVAPVCADFTVDFEIPATRLPDAPRLIYFPGSTIGNFVPLEAEPLLRRLCTLARPRGSLLIGVDLQKDVSILEAAYNDAEGVTAAFNRNLLVRINRELGANFDLDQYEHRAYYDSQLGRIEMYLESTCEQVVHLAGESYRFRKGETIHTENSHKYTLAGFATLAKAADFERVEVWTDAEDLFSVQLFLAR